MSECTIIFKNKKLFSKKRLNYMIKFVYLFTNRENEGQLPLISQENMVKIINKYFNYGKAIKIIKHAANRNKRKSIKK